MFFAVLKLIFNLSLASFAPHAPNELKRILSQPPFTFLLFSQKSTMYASNHTVLVSDKKDDFF
jgi:hypothetical protein